MTAAQVAVSIRGMTIRISDIKSSSTATWYAQAADLAGYSLDQARALAIELENPVELLRGNGQVAYWIHANGNYFAA